MNLDGGFELIGLFDGTTVNGILRVEGTPLVQRYNKGTNVFIPDFEAMAENVRPTVVLILADTASGAILVPQSIEFRYNGMLLTFGANGLSTNSGLAGFFKKMDAYSASIGGRTYNLPALRVMKNLMPISGYDNDRITVSGTIEIGGASIAFQELSREVVIQESTGNQYDVIISNNKGSRLVSAGESLTENVRVFKDGVEMTDYSGMTFEWYKMLGAGDEAWGTGRIKNVTTSDVNNVLKLRCDAKKNGTLLASGYDEVTDFSDPYLMRVKISGILGNTVRRGETAVMTPVAVKRSTGEEVPSLITNWNFSIKDNAGAPFVLTGKSAASFTADKASVTYEDMVRAKMGLSGVIAGTY